MKVGFLAHTVLFKWYTTLILQTNMLREVTFGLFDMWVLQSSSFSPGFSPGQFHHTLIMHFSSDLWFVYMYPLLQGLLKIHCRYWSPKNGQLRNPAINCPPLPKFISLLEGSCKKIWFKCVLLLLITVESYDSYHHFSTPSLPLTIHIITRVNDENDGRPRTKNCWCFLEHCRYKRFENASFTTDIWRKNVWD